MSTELCFENHSTQFFAFTFFDYIQFLGSSQPNICRRYSVAIPLFQKIWTWDFIFWLSSFHMKLVQLFSHRKITFIFSDCSLFNYLLISAMPSRYSFKCFRVRGIDSERPLCPVRSRVGLFARTTAWKPLIISSENICLVLTSATLSDLSPAVKPEHVSNPRFVRVSNKSAVSDKGCLKKRTRNMLTSRTLSWKCQKSTSAGIERAARKDSWVENILLIILWNLFN